MDNGSLDSNPADRLFFIGRHCRLMEKSKESRMAQQVVAWFGAPILRFYSFMLFQYQFFQFCYRYQRP